MKRLLVAAVGLAALTVGVMLAWYSVRQEREFQRLIAAGNTSLAHDDTSSAIEAFSGALVLKPESMLAHLKRGDSYRRRDEFDAALRDLQEAATLDRAAPRPVELLGDVNAAMGRYTRAVEHYVAFTQLDDRSSRVYYKLALAHYRNGEREQAIEPLRRAVSIDDRFTEAHYLLGMCLRERSGGDAVRSLTRAIEINPAFIPAREELADLHEQAGRRAQAVEQMEALAALEPSRAERLISLGLAYARWGRTDAAILTLGRAAERFPDAPVVYTALGRVWLETAELRNDRVALNKAVEALEATAGLPDASGETLMLHGRAIFLAGDLNRAERALLQATARPPVEPVAFKYLADAAERLGHVVVAHDALLRYAALVGDDAVEPSTAERLARLSQRLGRT